MHRIIDLREAENGQRERAAQILLSALSHAPSAWKDLASASEEVRSVVEDPERFGLLILDDGEVRGWIGAIRHSSYAWELHPLVVDPGYQRQGWGQLLVAALESVARSEGVLTIWLGTDDDFDGTNLYGRDLYPNVLGNLQQLRATNGHPFTFYERLGYCVTGVFPDVDGAGKHDILMAKRMVG
jgi:aminoglycoside 6'-N-acetyltransferase I